MSESQSHRDRDRQWERERYYDKPFFHFKVDPVLGDYFLWQRTFVMIFRANINDYLVYCHWPINNNETVAIIFFLFRKCFDWSNLHKWSVSCISSGIFNYHWFMIIYWSLKWQFWWIYCCLFILTMQLRRHADCDSRRKEAICMPMFHFLSATQKRDIPKITITNLSFYK